jgi:hypothetical protein
MGHNKMKRLKQKLIHWLRRKLTREQWYLDFCIHDMEISLWEMAHDLSMDKITWQQYNKFFELVHLHKKCLQEGLTEFSWEYLGKNGLLSEHLQEILKEEIGDKDIKYRL